jgi:hypothetical protein
LPLLPESLRFGVQVCRQGKQHWGRPAGSARTGVACQRTSMSDAGRADAAPCATRRPAGRRPPSDSKSPSSRCSALRPTVVRLPLDGPHAMGRPGLRRSSPPGACPPPWPPPLPPPPPPRPPRPSPPSSGPSLSLATSASICRPQFWTLAPGTPASSMARPLPGGRISPASVPSGEAIGKLPAPPGRAMPAASEWCTIMAGLGIRRLW